MSVRNSNRRLYEKNASIFGISAMNGRGKLTQLRCRVERIPVSRTCILEAYASIRWHALTVVEKQLICRKRKELKKKVK